MVRMSSRISLEIRGLPDLPRRHFQVQNSRKPLRCHEMTVSGLTMMRAERHSGQRRKSQIQRNRSEARSLGRLETERLKTMIWCRRARISVWSARRVRKPARKVEINEIRMLCMNREVISSIPQVQCLQLRRNYWQGQSAAGNSVRMAREDHAGFGMIRSHLQ
jgi:hypothetical protein